MNIYAATVLLGFTTLLPVYPGYAGISVVHASPVRNPVPEPFKTRFQVVAVQSTRGNPRQRNRGW